MGATGLFRIDSLVNERSDVIQLKYPVKDCAIIIWGGGSKINRGRLNLNQSSG